jgi:hypothetical protein
MVCATPGGLVKATGYTGYLFSRIRSARQFHLHLMDEKTMTESASGPIPYTDAHISAYPIEYIAGIDLYNAGEFHAAHDVWEERWMGEVGPKEKLFLQAMIQSAVAFHHLEIGRPGAARQMYVRAKEKFERLGTNVFMSLDLVHYQQQLDSSLSWLLTAADPKEISPPTISPPKIALLAEVSSYD